MTDLNPITMTRCHWKLSPPAEGSPIAEAIRAAEATDLAYWQAVAEFDARPDGVAVRESADWWRAIDHMEALRAAADQAEAALAAVRREARARRIRN
jgi:hypothetical protein